MERPFHSDTLHLGGSLTSSFETLKVPSTFCLVHTFENIERYLCMYTNYFVLFFLNFLLFGGVRFTLILGLISESLFRNTGFPHNSHLSVKTPPSVFIEYLIHSPDPKNIFQFHGVVTSL